MEKIPDLDREEEENDSCLRRQYFQWAAGVFLFAAVFFACGFAFARLLPSKNDPLSDAEQIIRNIRSDFFYYDETTEQDIGMGALKGIAAYLDDPYAVFYSAEEYAQLQQSDSGNYVGVGITILQEDGFFRISSVLENSPAFEAGLMNEDILSSVNGCSVQDMDMDGVIALFNMEAGDENTLIVLRAGEKIEVSVIAGEVYMPYVHFRMLNGRTGYIHISGFHGKVTEETENAVRTLMEQGMERLVLDVRDDPGGTLTDVCAVAEIFLPKDSVIATLKSRRGKQKVYKTESDGIDIPIAMLVNGNSASASELLAGALHDNDVAVLLGTDTYGKGIVQTYYELDNGENGAFKMTTEAYYTPADICIQDEGITPDYTVEMPKEIVYENIYELIPEEDPQLAAAIAYMEQRPDL